MDIDLLRRGLYVNLTGLSGDDRDAILRAMKMNLLLAGRMAANTVGRTLDELLYPDYRRVAVREPLFIVAPPRTGTTLLFHLLAKDPRFAAPTLGDTMAQAICLRRGLSTLERVDGRLGHPLVRARRWLNERLSKMDGTHVVRTDRLEEDELVFCDLFASFNVDLSFPPLVRAQGGYVVLDDRPAEVRARVMRAYRRYIQRLLYIGGRGQVYLGKNVQSAGRLASLNERFPDARMVHIVRHPYEQIPSALELYRSIIEAQRGSARPPGDPVWRYLVDALIDGHRRLLAWERRSDPRRWLTLRYEDLIADPGGTTRRVYEHFGVPVGADQEQVLRGADRVAGEFRKRRQYCLADYGVSPGELRDRMGDVFEAYDLRP